jgi:hypothetical protein
VIISHRYKFIFLHVPKAAGSSVAVHLAQHLGPMDVMVGSLGDCFRAGIIPNLRTSLELLHPRVARGVIGALRRRDLDKISTAHKRLYRFLGEAQGHATASAIRKAYPKEWGDYWKFCFVRNPYQRLVSLYHWRSKDHDVGDFITFLKWLSDDAHPHHLGWPIYSLNNRIAVDFVGRYERLHEDMKKVCDHIGIPFEPDKFPVAKKSPSFDYWDYYGPEEKKIVERLCAKEIETFAYTF